MSLLNSSPVFSWDSLSSAGKLPRSGGPGKKGSSAATCEAAVGNPEGRGPFILVVDEPPYRKTAGQPHILIYL